MPASGVSGPDGFTVQTTDSHGAASNIAIVSISVTPSTSGAGGNNNTGQGVDKFGIKEIYPTKSGGEERFMNMQNPEHPTKYDQNAYGKLESNKR